MDGQQPANVPQGYAVLQLLGSGQTSHVYLADYAQRGRVALKLPREELAVRPVLRRMFENEVQITLSLGHPNVVAAFDGFPTGPKAFLTLEYCAGGTLDQLLLERGKLPLDQALRLIVDVAQGLEYTHARSVLHRDVKPANVFLTEQGRAKLGDFGTGTYLGDDGAERVGTAFYMAPEIFEGRPPTVRSDVYSLGILAYEVLAGERPFVGESYDDLMVAHLSGFPKALLHYRKELSREAAKSIATAMARDPARRFGSVKEFREAFAAATGFNEAQPAAELRQETGRASRRAPEAPGQGPAAEPKREGQEHGKRRGLLAWLRRKPE